MPDGVKLLWICSNSRESKADFASSLGIAWSEHFGLHVFIKGLHSLEDLFKNPWSALLLEKEAEEFSWIVIKVSK